MRGFEHLNCLKCAEIHFQINELPVQSSHHFVFLLSQGWMSGGQHLISKCYVGLRGLYSDTFCVVLGLDDIFLGASLGVVILSHIYTISKILKNDQSNRSNLIAY